MPNMLAFHPSRKLAYLPTRPCKHQGKETPVLKPPKLDATGKLKSDCPETNPITNSVGRSNLAEVT